MFTVAESVSYWPEANCRIPVLTAATEGEPVQVELGRGLAAQSRADPGTTSPAGSDQPTPLLVPVAVEPSCRWTDDPRGEPSADVAVPTGTSEVDVPLGQQLEELDPVREATLEAFWALLEELGYEPL